MGRTLPVFSIVVPTYDRPGELRQCLKALGQLDYPSARFEAIVVDDGSPTSMDSVVASFEDQFDFTLLRQANAGPAAARNAGAEAACGQYIAFTDDDCRPAPGWLLAFAKQFERTPRALLGGRTENALPENAFSAASQSLIDYLYRYYNGSPRPFFASNNIAMAAQRFREVGGFDVSFPRAAAEDREFCDRWLHHGAPLHYAPEAVVHHAHEMTLRSFWRQHFNYGRGAYCFHEMRHQRGQDGVTPEPLSFYRDLLAHPFAQHSGSKAFGQSLLIVLSQAANAAGFFCEAALQSAPSAAPE